MAVRYRSATPGTLLSLVAVALLAVVSFNTPLLKSLNFLSASYSSGQYSGTITLGTLGYCLTFQGSQSCVGPKVGYEFNPNELFGVTQFNIPETVTKYLTYTLILHIIALACAVASFVFGLLSHISSLSVLCFPTCFASLTSTVSLLALVFDLVIFYIAKSRIDAVQGASASIGICVWLTLAAWLVSGIAGCAYGVGRCCCGAGGNRGNDRDRDGDDRMGKGGLGGYYNNQYNSNGPDEMRLHAIRDEQLRKKEQGLPSFQEMERTPLTNDGEDKYLYEDNPGHNHNQMPGGMPQNRNGAGLARDGSVLQGVGMGYGRRSDRGTPVNGGGYGAPEVPYNQGYLGQYGDVGQPVRRLSGSTTSGAGAAGWGAGGAGIDRPGQQQYGSGYNDPYQQHQQYDPYQQQPSHDPYQQHQQQQQYGDNAYGTTSDSHYSDHNYRTTPSPIMPMGNTPAPPAPVAQGYPQQHVYNDGNAPAGYDQRMSNGDPYGGYEDGIGAIGLAAQHDVGRHHSDYTGTAPPTTTNYNPHDQAGGYTVNQIHAPSPQHLSGTTHGQILQSSPVSPVDQARRSVVGNNNNNNQYDNRYSSYEDDGGAVLQGQGRPPSYDSAGVNAGYQPRPEKSGYQRQ